MFRLIATMRRGSVSGVPAASARYHTIESARAGAAVLLRDDRILRVTVVRNDVPPAYVEWLECYTLSTIVTRISVPSVHMAGHDAHGAAAHFELGRHGLALFLSPDAALPVLDITATTEQLETLVRELHAALAGRQSRRNPVAPTPEAGVQRPGFPRLRQSLSKDCGLPEGGDDIRTGRSVLACALHPEGHCEVVGAKRWRK